VKLATAFRTREAALRDIDETVKTLRGVVARHNKSVIGTGDGNNEEAFSSEFYRDLVDGKCSFTSIVAWVSCVLMICLGYTAMENDLNI
jgi:hypothetical protein